MAKLELSRLSKGALICLFVIFVVLCDAFNPYHVLGLSKSATIGDIKRAYKNLVRKQ